MLLILYAYRFTLQQYTQNEGCWGEMWVQKTKFQPLRSKKVTWKVKFQFWNLTGTDEAWMNWMLSLESACRESVLNIIQRDTYFLAFLRPKKGQWVQLGYALLMKFGEHNIMCTCVIKKLAIKRFQQLQQNL